MTLPVLADYVIGYRSWRPGKEGEQGELRAIGAIEATWRPGVSTAACRLRSPWAPDPGCECGLYATHGVPDAMLDASMIVLGAVRAWGDVQVHREGFRAERMQLLALLAGGGPCPLESERERLAARCYRVALRVDHRQRHRHLLARGRRQRLGLKPLAPVTDHQRATLRAAVVNTRSPGSAAATPLAAQTACAAA